MIIRLIIAGLLLYLLFVLVHSALSGSRRRQGRDANEPGQDMVLDPHCKSYVPRKDAYALKGQYFCSEACARAYLEKEDAGR